MDALIIVLLLGLIVAVVGVGGYIAATSRGKPADEPSEAQRMETQLRQTRDDLAQALTATQQTVLERVGSVDQRLDQRLEAINTSFDQRLHAVQTSMGQRLDAVQGDIGRSLNSQSETMTKVGQQLGLLGESARRILEVGQDVSSLKDVLQPPKLRGNFGEMLLEQLVGQILPASSYTRQYRFSDGSIADLVIHTPEGLVPIDAKFPVDSFRRMLEAPSEEERTRQRRQFLRDVRTRVEQCAKYIKPEDNTLDFALMYVPAENIYYEAIAGAGDDSAMTFALERRVQLVSPNTFHAFLQIVLRGFQRLQVEKNAEEIIARLGQLRNEFGKFRQEFEVLGTHVGRAKNKYDDLDKLAGRLGDRLELPVQARLQIDAPNEALPEPQELPGVTTRPRPASISNGNDDIT